MEANKNGEIRVDAAPGEYSLIVSGTGFVTSKQQLEVHGTSQSITVKLRIGGCTECVTVYPVQLKPKIPPPPADAVPRRCSNQPFTYSPPGVPVFFPSHGGVRYGVSLPRTEFDIYGDVVPLHIWIDNETDKDITLGACSMFADWDVDVRNGSEGIPSRRQQRDGLRWPEKASCGVDAPIVVHAYSCSAANQVSLRGEYDLPPGVYLVVERPRKTVPPSTRGRAYSLKFQIVPDQ